ncbi:hypothetical protein [Tunturibacter empetritectus]|uniref:Uncharacterized protein n=1 Tax=Tunturiibacter lichenicola TaxID=2051959 RepID=A0A7W8J986_9BACT|nr:hypothetical protein [Edaphobacter lichenicola]MBB5345015.1 hypothetical protein [Edaphobacter lichenicola]
MNEFISSLTARMDYLEPILCGMLIFFLVRGKAARQFGFLVALLSVRLACSVICLPLLYLSRHAIERHLAYQVYFYIYWTSYALEAILSLLVIYSIFKLAMAPLKGLQALGMLVFRWVAAISIAVAIGVAVTPHLSGITFMVAMITQLQQTSSILTLCLLLFVCFAIRPMGLSFRSRIFGVSLGLGVLAMVNLVNSAWLARYANMYSTFSLINGVAVGLTLLTWSAYFAFPEPKRRIITLPTTSPFLRWNQISMALGDDPGHVAVGGIPPELFAPAELEVMRRASAKMATGAIDAPASMHSLSA